MTITIHGNNVEGEQKSKIIHDFNEGLFLDRYYAPPHNEGTPLIIHAKRGKKISHFIFTVMKSMLML